MTLVSAALHGNHHSCNFIQPIEIDARPRHSAGRPCPGLDFARGRRAASACATGRATADAGRVRDDARHGCADIVGNSNRGNAAGHKRCRVAEQGCRRFECPVDAGRVRRAIRPGAIAAGASDCIRHSYRADPARQSRGRNSSHAGWEFAQLCDRDARTVAAVLVAGFRFRLVDAALCAHRVLVASRGHFEGALHAAADCFAAGCSRKGRLHERGPACGTVPCPPVSTVTGC